MHRLLTSWVVLVQLLGSVIAAPSNYIDQPDVDDVDLAAENKRLLELQDQGLDGVWDFLEEEDDYDSDRYRHGRCNKDNISIRKEW